MLPKFDITIEKSFPEIAKLGYKITSPQNNYYNCIAWAVEDDLRWWWPDPWFQAYWPSTAPRICTVEAFISAYKTIGYEQCDNIESESEYQKIAIFTDNNGVPTHASRELLEDNAWTSKMGKSYDISHNVYGLNSGLYGNPAVFMKKKIA